MSLVDLPALLHIASTQLGLITRLQALECGYSKNTIQRRVASGEWRVVMPGVYALAGFPPSWEQQLLAAVLWADPAAASHHAAGRLWQVRGIPSDLIEITTALRLSHPQVTTHRDWNLDQVGLRTIGGIAVTPPERTLMDLAAVYSRRRLEIAMDDFLARRLTTVERLDDELQRRGRSGRNGTVNFRALIEERRGRTGHPASGEETDFAIFMREWKVPLAVPQFRIHVRGKFIRRVDFSYPRRGVAIEVDTVWYHTGRADLENDLRVQNILQNARWILLRFSRADYRDRPAETAQLIWDAYNRPDVDRFLRENAPDLGRFAV